VSEPLYDIWLWDEAGNGKVVLGGVTMEEIRHWYPYALTGEVTRSGKHYSAELQGGGSASSCG